MQDAGSSHPVVASPPRAINMGLMDTEEDENMPGAVVDPTIDIGPSQRKRSQRSSGGRKTGEALEFTNHSTVLTRAQRRRLQQAVVASNQVRVPYKMRLRSQGPVVDIADLPPEKRRRRGGNRVVGESTVQGVDAQPPIPASNVDDQTNVDTSVDTNMDANVADQANVDTSVDDQTNMADQREPPDDLMQVNDF